MVELTLYHIPEGEITTNTKRKEQEGPPHYAAAYSIAETKSKDDYSHAFECKIATYTQEQKDKKI